VVWVSASPPRNNTKQGTKHTKKEAEFQLKIGRRIAGPLTGI